MQSHYNILILASIEAGPASRLTSPTNVKHLKYCFQSMESSANQALTYTYKIHQRANILSFSSRADLCPFHQTTLPMRMKPTIFRSQEGLNRGRLENQDYHHNKYNTRSKIRRNISSEYAAGLFYLL